MFNSCSYYSVVRNIDISICIDTEISGIIPIIIFSSIDTQIPAARSPSLSLVSIRLNSACIVTILIIPACFALTHFHSCLYCEYQIDLFFLKGKKKIKKCQNAYLAEYSGKYSQFWNVNVNGFFFLFCFLLILGASF